MREERKARGAAAEVIHRAQSSRDVGGAGGGRASRRRRVVGYDLVKQGVVICRAHVGERPGASENACWPRSKRRQLAKWVRRLR